MRRVPTNNPFRFKKLAQQLHGFTSGLSDNFSTAWAKLLVSSIGEKSVMRHDFDLCRGYNLQIGSHVTIEPYFVMFGRGRVEIADHCYIGHHCFVGTLDQVTIGSKTLVAAYCYIIDHNHGIVHGIPPYDQPVQISKVKIGSGVWIGTHSVILQGVTIGDGAVVGAGSIVTESIPPNAIAVGVPARVIKYRSESEIRLLGNE